MIAVLHVLAAVSSLSLGSMQERPAAELPRGRLVEELRIGSAFEDGHPLTFVTDLAVDSSGYLYVAQPQDYGIAVFDPAGRFLHTIGRQGQGPGEFVRVHEIGLLGDTLWASDPVSLRVNLFFRGGRSLSTMNLAVPAAELSTQGPMTPHALLPGGLAVGQVGLSATGFLENEHPNIPLVLIDRSSRIVRVLARLDLSHEIFSVRLGDGLLSGVQPFRDSPLWRVPSDGRSIVLVRRPVSPDERTTTFSVTKFLHTGDTVFSTTYSYAPTEVSARQRDSVIRGTVEGAPETGRSVARAIREALFIPKYHPPVYALLVGRDGTIWLRREPTGEVEEEWLVLDSDGVTARSVLGPSAVQLHEANGGAVWGVVHDELDVPYVVRYRIEPIRRPS
jgi:hypothetical protein